MFIKTAAVGPWGTNCHIVAAGPNSECLIVDPGLGAAEYVSAITAEYHLRPVAVLITHGHLDHTWNLLPMVDDLEIPAVIHASDRAFLADPLLALSPEAQGVVATLTPNQIWREPAEVITVAGNTNLSFAGFDITIVPTPGHTAGSVCFQFGNENLFTGDLLFKKAIGRTDLFSGSPEQMRQSLKYVLSSYQDETLIFPGHGENSTIGFERLNNPYLKDLGE